MAKTGVKKSAHFNGFSFQNLAEMLNRLPEPDYKADPQGVFPLAYLARYFYSLSINSRSKSFDVSENVLEDLLKEQSFFELEFAMLKRVISRPKTTVFVMEKAESHFRMIGVDRAGIDFLIEDMIAIYGNCFDVEKCRVNRFCYEGNYKVKLINPLKYERLRIMLKHIHDDNLFVINGPVIARNLKEKLMLGMRRIVSIDIEAYEFDHKKILEVGFMSINLEGLRLSGSPYIAHYIIKENEALSNGKHVRNNKHNFIFGNSETIGIKHVMKLLFSHFRSSGVIIVGHNICSDFGFLRNAGYPISEEHFKEDQIIDTQLMWSQCIRKPREMRSLENCLLDIGVSKDMLDSLHNAGNDACFTMALFLKLIQAEHNLLNDLLSISVLKKS